MDNPRMLKIAHTPPVECGTNLSAPINPTVDELLGFAGLLTGVCPEIVG